MTWLGHSVKRLSDRFTRKIRQQDLEVKRTRFDLVVEYISYWEEGYDRLGGRTFQDIVFGF